MLKNIVRAAAFAGACLLGGAAQAADIAPDTSYDWTGFYLGANVGYGWGSTEVSYDQVLAGAPAAAPAQAPLISNSPVGIDYDGVVGGGQIGYNWQIQGLVMGIEADVSASGVQGDTNANKIPCGQNGCSADTNWFGTGRLRVGYAIDSFMPYVTGGAAVVGVQGDVDNKACGSSSCGYDDTTWGWTLGGGVEWGFADNWSAKAEYLYINVDSPDFAGNNVKSDNLDLNVVRVGINYRIN